MLHRLSLLFLLIFFAVTVFAQVSAPPRNQTQAAVLADISRRTGETVTINSLGYQQWHYGTYEYVRSLGCPASPQTPPTSGNWQRFIFNYRGFDYIYLVSDNLQSLILCNEANLPTAIAPTAQPTATQQGTGQSGGGLAATATPNLPTATLQGSGQSGGGFAATSTPTCSLAPRLSINQLAIVTPGEANWLHDEATRNSTKIGEIPAGEQIAVLAGPVCDAVTGMNYWQVDYVGIVGWTSEGLNGQYWLEPLLNIFSPETVNNAFVPDWVNNLSESTVIAFSTEFIAVMPATNQVNLIRQSDNTQLANLTYAGAAVTELEFSPTASYFVAGLDNGQLTILENPPNYTTLANLSHEGGISAAVFNHSENLLVVADEALILTFWSLQSLEAPLRRIDIGHVAGDLEFSSDDRLLIIRNRQGELITALQIP